MNAIYYEMRLARIQRENFFIEMMIASTASGSAITGLGFWQDNLVGRWVWGTLAVIAAMVSIIKPLYAPGKKIELFTRQRQSYHNNYFALEKLINSMQQSAEISDEHRKRFDTIFDRHVQLSGEDEPAVKPEILQRAEQRCAQALPPDLFWQYWADRVEAASAIQGPPGLEAAPAPSEHDTHKTSRRDPTPILITSPEERKVAGR